MRVRSCKGCQVCVFALYNRPDLLWLLHEILRERSVDDKVCVIRDDWTSFVDCHPQRSFRRTDRLQVVEKAHVGEWCNFDWDALLELKEHKEALMGANQTHKKPSPMYREYESSCDNPRLR